jgi:hypothetical protein
MEVTAAVCCVSDARGTRVRGLELGTHTGGREVATQGARSGQWPDVPAPRKRDWDRGQPTRQTDNHRSIMKLTT